MNPFAIAEPYAQALFHLPASQEEMESREELLKEIARVWQKDKSFRQFFLNPEIAFETKRTVLEKAIKEAPLVEFLLLLLKKAKIKFLPQIASKYQQLSAVKSGKSIVTLMSARPVEATLKEKLRTNLEHMYVKPVLLREKIDPRLIGGVILMVDCTMIDFSVKGRLEELTKRLLRD